jgi:hypothetical protein
MFHLCSHRVCPKLCERRLRYSVSDILSFATFFCYCTDLSQVEALLYSSSLLSWRHVPCSEEARHWVDGADVEALVVKIAEVLHGHELRVQCRTTRRGRIWGWGMTWR